MKLRLVRLTEAPIDVLKKKNMPDDIIDFALGIDDVTGYGVWVANQVKQDPSLKGKEREFKYIKDYVHAENPQTKGLSFDQLLTKAKDWHKQFKVVDGGVASQHDDAVKTYPDGYRMKSRSCSQPLKVLWQPVSRSYVAPYPKTTSMTTLAANERAKLIQNIMEMQGDTGTLAGLLRALNGKECTAFRAALDVLLTLREDLGEAADDTGNAMSDPRFHEVVDLMVVEMSLDRGTAEGILAWAYNYACCVSTVATHRAMHHAVALSSGKLISGLFLGLIAGLLIAAALSYL